MKSNLPHLQCGKREKILVNTGMVQSEMYSLQRWRRRRLKVDLFKNGISWTVQRL